ncbi:MAG TPA: PhzF family phenazine biosynthesis protein [Bryobacteraceae bacterium]|nr:PhzF family phenazine biosynthesis protein [Bryobacteraceae bacterium]
MTYRYLVVDVFTDRVLEGNPLAVFPESTGLDDVTMQRIARELNLSETVFVVPPTRPECAAAIRIFAPVKEMLFAGHPVVGSTYVLLKEGVLARDTERFTLEVKIGPLPIRVERGESPLIWLRTPPISFGRTFERALCADALGLNTEDLLDVAPQMLSAGNRAAFIPLQNKSAVDRAWLDARGLASLKDGSKDALVVFVFSPTPEGAYSRMFGQDIGVAEDPASGSLTGPLAAYMMQTGLVASANGTRFVSEQGTKMGRRSILHVAVHGEHGRDGIDIGGSVVPIIEGRMTV